MSSLERRALDALREVVLPRIEKSLVDVGMIERIEVRDGRAHVLLHFKPAYISKSQLRQLVEERLRGVEGITEVEIEFIAQTAAGGAPQQQARPLRRLELPGVRERVAIFSGKGGVGKSTVSVNLAVALSQAGARVGLFDGDVHGPNVPHLLGIEDERPMLTEGRKIAPIEKYGLKTISIGLLVEPEEALIWRGPMITKAIDELLGGVDWGELDFLIIDLPPGTGDAQLGLAQDVELTGSIAVTTPQDVSLADVRRGITAFKRLEVPLWGIIENMSFFVCPHCGKPSEIFGRGGGQLEAERQGVPLLGKIPIDLAVREGGDRGVPIVLQTPDAPASQEFRKIAAFLLEKQQNSRERV
jgi:ATP-binding protein involved in chromosome partitioning